MSEGEITIGLEQPGIQPEIDQQSRQHIREFTKSTPEGREARAATATRLFDIRRERFELGMRIKEIKSTIDQLTTDVTSNQSKLEDTKRELQQVEETLRNWNYSILHRLRLLLDSSERTAENVALQEAGEKLTHLRTASTSIETTLRQERTELKLLEEEFRNYIEALDEIRKPRDILNGFYAEQGAKYDLEQRLGRGDVQAMIEKYNVYVTHGIMLDRLSQVLINNPGFRERMAIILAMKPTLSAATLCWFDHTRVAGSYGDISEKKDIVTGGLWSDIGVMISKGRVEAASRQDNGSVINGVKNRSSEAHATLIGNMPIAEQIHDAIGRPGENEILVPESAGYNELFIGDPEIAGIFVRTQTARPSINHQEVTIIANELGIPLIAQADDGMFYEGVFDPSIGRIIIVPDKKIKPTDLVDRQYHPSPDTEASLKQTAMQHLSPLVMV